MSAIDVGLIRPVLVGATVAGLIMLFIAASDIALSEADASTMIARLVGLPDAHRAGDSVIFEVGHQLVGYQITLGCSVAFLALPYFAVTAALLNVHRINAGRAILALAAALAAITVFNQLRLITIGFGMHLWGASVGYERTHVFIGTIISTAGVMASGLAYIRIITSNDPASITNRDRRHDALTATDLA